MWSNGILIKKGNIPALIMYILFDVNNKKAEG